MGVTVRRRRDRGGAWVVDYTDRQGRRKCRAKDRRGVRFGATPEGHDRAQAEAVELRKELGQAASPSNQDPDITFRSYADTWLAQAEAALADKRGHKRNTLISYRRQLEKHIYPDIGDQRIRDLHRAGLAQFLERKKATKKLHGAGTLSEASVATTYRILRAILERACFDGIILANPARALWSRLPTYTRRRLKDKAVDPANVMARAEIDRLLAQADGQEFVMLATKYRAGLRMGELVALKVADVDLAHQRLRVQHSLMDKRDGLSVRDRLDSPKSGGDRWVEIGRVLVQILDGHLVQRQAENFKAGQETPWLFHEGGHPVNGAKLRRRFGILARRAGLPAHLTPHSLRHSYATHMLGARKSLTWVAAQLGHSSPKITLDHYAWAIPSENVGAADALDAPALAVATARNQNGADPDVLAAETQSNQQASSGDKPRLDSTLVMTGYRNHSDPHDKSNRDGLNTSKSDRDEGEPS